MKITLQFTSKAGFGAKEASMILHENDDGDSDVGGSKVERIGRVSRRWAKLSDRSFVHAQQAVNWLWPFLAA